LAHRVSRVVSAVPVLAPVAVASFGVVGTLLLLLGEFRVPVVLAAGGLTTVLLIRLVGLGDPVALRRDRICDVIALGIALGFAVVNARYTHQNILVGRDPGVYTVAGQWLAHHHSILIPSQSEVFGIHEITARSAGLRPSAPGVLSAQGAHLLPQLLGLTSAVFGESAMFRLNVVIGGFGLLAVYGFARLIVSRGWALIAMVLLGGTLPQLAFSRDNYTEPVSQLLIFGGLSLLWVAGRGRPARWAVAGLVLASGCMARIDAFLVLPALVTYAGAVTALAPRGRERAMASRDSLAFLAGAGVSGLLGLLDLQRLSNGYYHDLHSQFRSIELLLLAAVVGAVVLVVVSWSTPVVGWLERQGPRWRGPVSLVAAAGVVLVGLALASRPLFGPVHAAGTGQSQIFISTSQAAAHETVDATRSYAENSVTWLAWYIGPLATALALLGTALLIRRAVRSGRLELAPFLLILLSTAGAYLYNPSITPDQIWAMRRYVPIVMPGVAIAAVLALGALAPRVRRRWMPVTAAVTGLALFAPVAFITWPLFRVREGGSQLPEAQRVCAALPDQAAVLALGDLAVRYPQTLRSYCHVPAGAMSAAPTSVLLAAAAHNAAAAGRELFVVCIDTALATVPTATGTAAALPISTVAVRTWVGSLSKPPRTAQRTQRSMYVGKVGVDGLVTWVRR
jgi:hypothetical protein